MRKFLTLIFLCIYLSIYAGNTITVVDDSSNEPLPAATVFSQTGIIIGLTDKDGRITIPSANDYPVSVRCLGYETTRCNEGLQEVRMEMAAYSLPEVLVTPVDRPVVRMVCYVREYLSAVVGADTLMNYNEHMADVFFTTRDKVKGFKPKTSPRFLRSRLYARKATSGGNDSIYQPRFRNDTFAWEHLINLPNEQVTVSNAIANGAKTDTVAGKYGVKTLMRKPDGNTYIVQTDYLANSKNHTLSPFIFKMLGMTIDFNECQGSLIYRSNDTTSSFSPADLVSASFSMSVLGKGKWIKTMLRTDNEVQMYCFYEIYPVHVDYLTVNEAKELSGNENASVEWSISPDARPLEPAIQRIVNHFRSN